MLVCGREASRTKPRRLRSGLLTRGKAVHMHRHRSVLSVTAPQASDSTNPGEFVESLSRCYTRENPCRVSRDSKVRQRVFAWRGVCQSKCKPPPRAAVTVTSDKVSKADLRASAAAAVAVSPAAATVFPILLQRTTTESLIPEKELLG